MSICVSKCMTHPMTLEGQVQFPVLAPKNTRIKVLRQFSLHNVTSFSLKACSICLSNTVSLPCKLNCFLVL